MLACGSGPWHQPCIFTALCHLQELARSSQWAKVAETVEDIEASWCMAVVVQKAVEEEQWQCVWRLAAHCSIQQREVLAKQAASQGQWQCVTDLVEIGVGRTVRGSLLTQAVAGRNVACAAKLLNVGVCRHHREDSLRQAVEAGQWDFVVELLRTFNDPDLQEFVMKEAVKRESWQLVWGMVRQGLTVDLMESVCDEAVGCGQWDLLLHLLQQGLSPSEWIIDQLFRSNMAQSLLDNFDQGSLSGGLKGLLLMTGVRHGQADITLQIVEREKVSDAELMEAMKHAVHLLDAKVFLKLLQHSPRSRRVFKQKFHQQHWKESLVLCDPDGDGRDGGEVCWIFNSLIDEREHDLALHVAVINRYGVYLVHELYKKSPPTFDLRKQKFRQALRKLHAEDRFEYREMTLNMYHKSEADRSFLFRHAIRLGELSLVCRFCGLGVKQGDLKFAVPWLVLNRDTYNERNTLEFLHAHIPKKNKTWFDQYAVKCSLSEYFMAKSDSKLTTLIDLFTNNKDKVFCRQFFRSAVAEAVKDDDADCFVEIYKCHLDSTTQSYDFEQKEDSHFAYSTAIQAGRKHFTAKLYQKRISDMLYPTKDLMILVETVFETQSYDVLLHLYDYSDPSAILVEEDAYKPLCWCLEKMLNEGHTWTGLAPVLEHWIRKAHFHALHDMLSSVLDLIQHEQGHWTFNLLGVAHWSVKQHFYNLAFVLAFVIEDWNLVETVFCVEDVVINENIICYALPFASHKCLFAIGALMLKACPVNSHTLQRFRFNGEGGEMARECRKLGLSDWALVLSLSDLELDRDGNVRKELQACNNQVVLDHCMKRAIINEWWETVAELLTRCEDKAILEKVLKLSVTSGQSKIAEAVIGRVDLCLIRENNYDFLSEEDVCKTLLHLAVENTENLKVICLLIASGLSTFQRDVKFVKATDNHNCPLLYALDCGRLPIVKLMLKSGVLTHKRLDRIRRDREMQQRLRSHYVGEKWKERYRCILSAAATPLRLDHMARLVISHLIGCHPGRADRIERLPVPPAIKSLVHFRDVISAIEREEVAMNQADTP